MTLNLPCSSLVCTENRCLQPQAVGQHPVEYTNKKEHVNQHQMEAHQYEKNSTLKNRSTKNILFWFGNQLPFQ